MQELQGELSEIVLDMTPPRTIKFSHYKTNILDFASKIYSLNFDEVVFGFLLRPACTVPKLWQRCKQSSTEPELLLLIAITLVGSIINDC